MNQEASEAVLLSLLMARPGNHFPLVLLTFLAFTLASYCKSQAYVRFHVPLNLSASLLFSTKTFKHVTLSLFNTLSNTLYLFCIFLMFIK